MCSRFARAFATVDLDPVRPSARVQPGARTHGLRFMTTEARTELPELQVAVSAAILSLHPAMRWCSDLFVDADGALEHRAGVVAFVPDCFEHPGG
jgi:hypothetical protein